MPRATESMSCTRRLIISMARTRIHNGWGETMRVGFIGLGAMGSRMAGRLLAARHDVLVYNRTPERTRPLEQGGAKVAPTAKQLAAGVDVVCSSVANDAALEEVMFGPDGALAGARPGAVVIEMSTVSPRTSRRLHEAARSKGVAVLDAPVSGSTVQAEQGQLVIFVGGEEDVYQKCQPILAVLGSKTFYLGPSGAGATMKLCVNTLLGLGVQALAEAIALGVKAGLPRERFLEVLGETAVVSPSQKAKLENVRTNEYPPAFALRLMFKDFGLIVETAMELSVPMPATAAAVQVAAAVAGIGTDNSMAVSTINPKSLNISRSANAGRYSFVRTFSSFAFWLGETTAVSPSTCRNRSRGSPAFTPSAIASASAWTPSPSSVLTHSFIVAPAPLGPR